VKTYRDIGKRIVEFEQKGEERANYGAELLKKLAKDLSLKYGKGFSRSNLQYMRLLYIKYPKCQTLSGKLSWSHYVELLGVSDDLARSFYEKQCIRENWSVTDLPPKNETISFSNPSLQRELKRQIDSMLFERLALSKDKEGVLQLARKGQIVEKEEDIIKDPYVFEFLGIPEPHQYTEKELKQKLTDNLQMFLLELGKGFCIHRSSIQNYT